MPGRTLDPLDLLGRLVAFDTVSAKSNLALIEWAADYLDGFGARPVLTYDESGAKANLFATIGPEAPGGIVLSGHTDVVPVEPAEWASDPFAATRFGDRIYGRGTADMKGFIALALSRAGAFKDAARRIPVHLALTFDEEVGCLGAPHLIDALPALELRPRLAIIGEPTGMRPVNAHKGCSVFSTTVIGLDGHASAPQRGVSAISAAVEIIAVLDRIAARQRAAADPATRFDPPYTTLNVGRIEGGTAFNVIARECRFTWEIRPLPGIDPACVLREIDDFVAQDLLPRMRRVHPASSVVTTPIVTVPPLAPDPHGAAETLVRDLAGDGEPGTVAFTTEAGLFQRAGLSAMICGPGSIADAHRPDEFVSLAQLEAGGVFLDRLTARVVGG